MVYSQWVLMQLSTFDCYGDLLDGGNAMVYMSAIPQGAIRSRLIFVQAFDVCLVNKLIRREDARRD